MVHKMGLAARKPDFLLANNKGADQSDQSLCYMHLLSTMHTVNSEIFAKVYEINKLSLKHTLVLIFNVAYMSINAFRENKILAKIFEFAVIAKKCK